MLKLLKSKVSPFNSIVDKNIDWYMAQLTQEKESKLVGVEVFYISFNRFVWLSSMQITLLSNCLHSKKKMLSVSDADSDIFKKRFRYLNSLLSAYFA